MSKTVLDLFRVFKITFPTVLVLFFGEHLIIKIFANGAFIF